MQVLTMKDIQRFVNEWVLQSNDDYEHFLKKFIFKHYKYNSSIFSDIEAILHFQSGELNIYPNTESLNLYLKKGESVNITYEKINEENSEILAYWVEQAELTPDDIKYSLLEYRYTINEYYDRDVLNISMSEKKNYENFHSPINTKNTEELFWGLTIILKLVEFETYLSEMLIEANLFNSGTKNQFIKDFERYLPMYCYSNTLYDSFSIHQLQEKFFDYHLKENNDKPPYDTNKLRKGRPKAPFKTLEELILKDKKTSYTKIKKQLIDTYKGLKGQELAFLAIALKKLRFLKTSYTDKNQLFYALCKELNSNNGAPSSFSKYYKLENEELYETEIDVIKLKILEFI